MIVLVAHLLTFCGQRWEAGDSETPRSTSTEENDNNWRRKKQAHKNIFHSAAVTLRTVGWLRNDVVAIVTDKLWNEVLLFLWQGKQANPVGQMIIMRFLKSKCVEWFNYKLHFLLVFFFLMLFHFI